MVNGTNWRILMIEDNEDDRRIYKRYLKKRALHPPIFVEAETAEEGLKLAQSFNPDCILLDYSLPDRDGLNLLDDLLPKRAPSPYPIIMLTGMGNEAVAVKALKGGAQDYLVKGDLKADNLFKAINNAIEKFQLSSELEEKRQELERSHAELATQAENLRASKQQLEQEATERRQVQDTLLESEKHYRKMAQFSASVIHNLGNVLNNMNTSIYQMRHTLETSQLKSLSMANNLVREHLDDLGSFFQTHPKGKLLPQYLINTGKGLQRESQRMLKELDDMVDKVNMMREIIDHQQSHAKEALRSNPLELHQMLNKVFSLTEEIISSHRIDIEKAFHATTPILANRAKSLQILINLIKNAVEAMANNEERPRILRITTRDAENHMVRLMITDTGCGISKENLKNLFSYGFSTKMDGHGFGLPYCALAMKEMGGNIVVESHGINQGTTFTLSFPTVKSKDLL